MKVKFRDVPRWLVLQRKITLVIGGVALIFWLVTDRSSALSPLILIAAIGVPLIGILVMLIWGYFDIRRLTGMSKAEALLYLSGSSPIFYGNLYFHERENWLDGKKIPFYDWEHPGFLSRWNYKDKKN